MQLARVVDKGSLIGPVDPDRPRPQRNLLLGAAGVKTLDLLRRPLLLRVHHAGKDFGVFGSILHAHAAVTLGPHNVGEQVLVRGVVLKHRQTIEEIEPNVP